MFYDTRVAWRRLPTAMNISVSILGDSTKRSLATCIAFGAILLNFGCNSSEPPVPVAPTKPLSAEQEALLKQIEDQPQEKRKAFIMAHLPDIQKYSIENKTFGDRMNEAAGIKPSTKN